VEWQQFASREILHESAVQPTGEIHTDVRKIGAGRATAPVVLHAPEPEYSEAARGLAYSGKVLVYLQVNEAGIPMKVRIIKPAGLGLDERAVEAVKDYKFNPAMENGQPVAVEMNIEVNFRVY
jgi:protein TonB